MKSIFVAAVFMVGSLVCAEQSHLAPSIPKPTLAEVIADRTNDVVTISLDTNETIWVGGRVTLPEEIDGISSTAGLSNSTPFVIEAARNVKHSSIRRVMDSLGKQNFWKISFRVQQETAELQPVRSRRQSVEATHTNHAALRSDVAVLELILGGQHQYKMYYMSTCGMQLDQFKREYPSVPQAFWDQYATELEDDWISDSISLVRTRLTEEEFRELAEFAMSSTGRKLTQEQVVMLKDFQSESRQQAKDRKVKVESMLGEKGYREAASTAICINNLRQIRGAKEQYEMDYGNAKKGFIVSEDALSPLLRSGFRSLCCPDGGKYNINAFGENPTCTIRGHTLENTESNHGLESTSAPPAAGTLETHP